MIASRNILKKGLILFLKVNSMGIKFLFFSILLPKKIAVDAYGDISLLITTVTFFIFFIGFDFYNYVHRDFITDNRQAIAAKLVNQAAFNFSAFALVVPIFYAVMSYNELPFIAISTILLFTEYFGQEVYRLLIVFSKPVVANVLLFFRSSLWILALLLISKLNEYQIEIFDVLLYWVVGNSILVVLTLGYCFSLKGISFKQIKLDYDWIKKGILISIPFLLSTITLKIIELSDRYIIKYFYSSEEVGIYSFYSNISNSLNVIINTTIVIIIYPKILKAFKNDNKEEKSKLLKEYKKEMFLFLGASVILLFLCINPLITWIGKEEYATDLITFWTLLLANVFFNLSLIPHIILYALHKDRAIMIPVVYGCILNVVLNFILIPYIGLIGAAIATLASFLLILIFKFNAAKKCNFGL